MARLTEIHRQQGGNSVEQVLETCPLWKGADPPKRGPDPNMTIAYRPQNRLDLRQRDGVYFVKVSLRSESQLY
jgi:hypothetical protein